MEIHNIQKLKDRRRELRKRATPQENLLWEELRNNKLGVKFKRHLVIKRKISLGSKTQRGAETAGILASIIPSLN